MYTGTLIEDLIATVERAEEHTDAPANAQDEKLAYCYLPRSTHWASGNRIYSGWHKWRLRPRQCGAQFRSHGANRAGGEHPKSTSPRRSTTRAW